MNTEVTKAASESKDMDRAIATICAVQGERYTVFGSDRVARDYANDVVTARALAKFHGGYVKDENGRIYPRAI